MAIWQLCGDPSFLSSAWIADMGVYIGPWPLLPAGTLDGAAADVNFVVALPNPVDPLDPDQVIDGTYPTPIWQCWRTADVGFTPTGWSWLSSGGAPTPVGADRPAAGSHLWVFVYSGDPPANPPEFYVPRSYAAGGAATVATVDGGWSAWQPGVEVMHAAQHTISDGSEFSGTETWLTGPADTTQVQGQQHTSTSGPQPVYTPPPFLPPSLVAASITDGDGYIADGTGLSGGLDKHGLDTIVGGPTRDVESRMIMALDVERRGSASLGPLYSDTAVGKAIWSQSRDGWKASASLDDDPAHDALVDGVDYQPPFFSDSDWLDLESPAPRYQWQDIANYLLFDTVAFRTSPTTDSFTVDVTAGIRVYVTSPPLTTTTGGSYDDSDGFFDGWVADLSFVDTVALEWSFDGFAETGSGDLGGVAVPLSALFADGNTQTVTVAWEGDWSAWSMGTLPAAPLPLPGSPTGVGGYAGAVLKFDPDMLFDDPVFGWTGIPYVAVNPRWRYHLPYTVGPAVAWHTAGGHWSSSADMRILTPGVGWVPIVDGPA